MKTVIFTEEQLLSPEEIGRALFQDEQDPRSSAYVRKLKRPSVSWSRIMIRLISHFFGLGIFMAGLRYLGLSVAVSVVFTIIALAADVIFALKRITICLIKIYQRYTPASIRNKCRFEPSCSEYMLLVIEKYGLMKGLQKGISRLKRCNINGGGFDFP